MNQKTFKITESDIRDSWYDYNFKEGEEVILMSKVYDDCEKPYWYAIKLSEAPNGIGGNLNKEIKTFHGWRGSWSSNGAYTVSTYAHGVRKIEKITVKTINGRYGKEKEYKIRVGKDIHPEWD